MYYFIVNDDHIVLLHFFLYTLFLFKLLAKKGTWFTDIVFIPFIRPYRARTKLYPHPLHCTNIRYTLYVNMNYIND